MNLGFEGERVERGDNNAIRGPDVDVLGDKNLECFVPMYPSEPKTSSSRSSADE